jgi:putative membrane protein
VAATQLPLGYDMTGGRRLIGLPVIGLGASVAVLSHRRWREREAAILTGSPLPPSRLPQLLTFGIVVVAVVAALIVASGRGS